MTSEVRRLVLLGSTGSIGTQTLEVVAHLNRLHARGVWPHRFEIVGLAAGRRLGLLLSQAAQYGVRDVAVSDELAADTSSAETRLRRGRHAAEQLVREVDADLVLAAMVGAAGLPATLAAIELGRDVALANKETLVAAGELVVPAARRSGARLLPVDSEHAAIWQCLHATSPGVMEPPPVQCPKEVRRIILTASGGPFRTKSLGEVYNCTPREALAHPTWNMGPKVTIDSASLTNKALEVIEAHWLFGVGGDRIDVLVHPQSVVHSLVEFADGNIIAQLGPPDMRMPIQLALAHPHRPECGGRRLDLASMSRLEFEPPDHDRFPALRLAYDVIERGGSTGAVFNAANEEAVHAFLDGGIPFGRIGELVCSAVSELDSHPLHCLADVHAADDEARRFVRSQLQTPSAR